MGRDREKTRQLAKDQKRLARGKPTEHPMLGALDRMLCDLHAMLGPPVERVSMLTVYKACLILVAVLGIVGAAVLNWLVGFMWCFIWLLVISLALARNLALNEFGPFKVSSDERANMLVRGGVECTLRLSSTWPHPGIVRFVCMSDSHGKHHSVSVPPGDVLLVAGDLTRRGTAEELDDFNHWLGTLPHKRKIVVAGDHDWCLESVDRETRAPIDHKVAKAVRARLTNCTLLENDTCTVHGLRIWGSAYSQRLPGVPLESIT